MKLTVKEIAIHTALAASDRPMTLATVADLEEAPSAVEEDRLARIEALERAWASDAPALTVAERDTWATAVFLGLGIAAPGYELQDEGMVLVRVEDGQTWVIKDITPEDPADCPACGTAGDPAATHPRLEGCLVCTHCGVVFNEFTGEKVEEAPVAEPTAKKKRAILNPQPKIDAKVAAAAKAGFSLDYDRNSRLWWAAPEEWTAEPLVTMNSRDFAAYGPADLVDFLLATYASAEGEGEAAPVETPADEAAE